MWCVVNIKIFVIVALTHTLELRPSKKVLIWNWPLKDVSASSSESFSTTVFSSEHIWFAYVRRYDSTQTDMMSLFARTTADYVHFALELPCCRLQAAHAVCDSGEIWNRTSLPPRWLFSSHTVCCDSFWEFNLVSIWKISNRCGSDWYSIPDTCFWWGTQRWAVSPAALVFSGRSSHISSGDLCVSVTCVRAAVLTFYMCRRPWHSWLC